MTVTNKEAEKYMKENKEKILTVNPKANTAIIFRSYSKDAWHFVTPVKKGQRSCVVVFYKEG